MHGVTAVMRAEFFYFKPPRRKLLVFSRRIVTTLTLCAGQRNNVSHDFNLSRLMTHKVMYRLTGTSPRQMIQYRLLT